jgi:NAD-dependent DNA ligase
VVVGTARIEYVTAHNARFVVDNKLAPGAKILIRRSGDVIPAVEKVIVPATEPKMPSAHPWKWLEGDSSSAHIILDNEKSEGTPKEVKQARLVLFAKTFELAGLGPGIATKLVEGGITTPGKLCTSSESSLSNAIGNGNGKKLSSQITLLGAKVSELKLMVASAVLPRGMGETKLGALFQAQPDPRNWHQLPEPAGWTASSLHELVTALPSYVKWREEEFPQWSYPILPSPVEPQTIEKKGTICFTGVRSKPLEALLKAAGWETIDTVSSKLNVLVIPDGDETDTGKVKKARQLGTVQILHLSQVQTTLGV